MIAIPRRRIWPLDAPEMPLPSDDFLRTARLWGDNTTKLQQPGKTRRGLKLVDIHPQLEAIIEEALFGRGSLQMEFTIDRQRRRRLKVVPGHRWGSPQTEEDGGATGPEPCDVMVIGKMLGREEVGRGRHFIGPTGQQLLETVRMMGLPGFPRWYMTNLLKTECPDPDNESSWREQWAKAQLHLLHQELRLVRPKFILCLGADAVKVLLGRQWTMSRVEGRVVDFEFSLRRSEDDPPRQHHCLVMGATHPAAVLYAPEKLPVFERAVRRFGSLVEGSRWDRAEEGLDHRVIDNEVDLLRLCQEIDTHDPHGIVAMDAEWEGEHPQNAGAYLRTIQLSWKHKSAAVIVLRKQGGARGFRRVRRDGGWTTQGGIERAIALLRRLLKNKRISGHFFAADLEWLIDIGLDLRPQFAAPADWRLCPTEGGLDTALMAHAVEETADLTLTGQALRYTQAPRYDVALNAWKEQYCKEHGLKASQLEGYGNCPDEILYPYAAYDADVTYRLCQRHMRNLSCDAFSNNCWEAFWISQRAVLGVIEMKQVGLLVDSRRVDELTSLYMHTRGELEREIREWARWPDLNLNSHPQVRELLFGTRYNGADMVDGERPQLRPEGALSLEAKPVLTTGKRQKPWEEIEREDREDEFTASTNKSVLGIMTHEAKQLTVWRDGDWVQRDCSREVNLIRNWRFISQILKSTLRVPQCRVDDEDFDVDEDGNWIYDAGLPGSICDDGRVRTTIYQTKETGRWASARPPLQNLSKRRESDYKRILGDSYRYTLRSVICAAPGRVLLEADYVGAELYGMAIMSGDPTMIDHATRNQLPEDHPNYYDIHSNIAVLAFRYDCPPTKAGLKAIGKAHMRIVAKSVIFGLAYGRGAKAIAVAAREEGVEITTEDAQAIIDAVFTMYPGLVPFFAECRERAVTQPDQDDPAPRWLCGPFGRFRRFYETRDRQVRGDIERQAQNFPIQGMIADAVSLAVAELYDYRERAYAAGESRETLDYYLALQIHDAVILDVLAEHVPRVVDEVLPHCMIRSVPIYTTTLDGMPDGRGPYYLGIDVEPFQYWGETLSPDECLQYGFDPRYAHWHKQTEGYTHDNFPRQIWRAGKLRPLEETTAA